MVAPAPHPHHGDMNETAPAPPAPSLAPAAPAPGELIRPRDDRKLAGVASGIARRLGVEPWVIRTAFVAVTLFGGGGIALYLLGWIAIRDEAETRSHAQRWFGPTGGDRRPDAQEA